MTTQPQAPALINAIVACGTCDSVFRAHEGRQTCPCCGGDPAFIVVDYSESDAGNPPPTAPSSEEAPAEPADAGQAPPTEAGVPSSEPPVPAGQDHGDGESEEPAPPPTSSSRRRSRP